MKRKWITNLLIGIVVIIGLIFLISTIKQEIAEKNNEVIRKENQDRGNVQNSVTITNGNIKNEGLIDKFIEAKTERENAKLIINQDNNNIILEYFIGDNDKRYNEYMKNNENPDKIEFNQEAVDTRNLSDEQIASEYKRIYGYYTISINGDKKEYDALHWSVKRKTTNNEVQLYFDTFILQVTELPEICKYNLDSSEYEEKFKLHYNQRKDLGIKEIYDNGEYKIKTFGGDVSITMENDMVYTLKDALNQGIITCDDIINQAKKDEKYGICSSGYYKDGGSTEYLYKEYTILKLNTLDGDKDLVIGMQGAIINSYNKNK